MGARKKKKKKNSGVHLTPLLEQQVAQPFFRKKRPLLHHISAIIQILKHPIKTKSYLLFCLTKIPGGGEAKREEEKEGEMRERRRRQTNYFYLN